MPDLKRIPLLAGLALLGIIAANGSAPAEYSTFDEAKVAAAEQGKPILIDIFTEW